MPLSTKTVHVSNPQVQAWNLLQLIKWQMISSEFFALPWMKLEFIINRYLAEVINTGKLTQQHQGQKHFPRQKVILCSLSLIIVWCTKTKSNWKMLACLLPKAGDTRARNFRKFSNKFLHSCAYEQYDVKTQSLKLVGNLCKFIACVLPV